MTDPPDTYDDAVDDTVTTSTVRVTITRPTLLQRIVFLLILLVGFAITVLVIIPVGILIALVVFALVLVGRARLAIARVFRPDGPRQGRRNVRVISRDAP